MEGKQTKLRRRNIYISTLFPPPRPAPLPNSHRLGARGLRCMRYLTREKIYYGCYGKARQREGVTRRVCVCVRRDDSSSAVKSGRRARSSARRKSDILAAAVRSGDRTQVSTCEPQSSTTINHHRSTTITTNPSSSSSLYHPITATYTARRYTSRCTSSFSTARIFHRFFTRERRTRGVFHGRDKPIAISRERRKERRRTRII